MKLGIESKTIIIYSTLIIFILVLFSFVSFIVVRKNLEKELNDRLINSTKHASLLIKSYKINFEPGDEILAEYKILQQKLIEIKYIASLNNIHIINENYDILIDANGEENIGTPFIFSKYYINELKKSFNGETTVSPVYKGEFGNMLKSAFIPIRYNKKINVVLATEASPEFLQTLVKLGKVILYIGIITIIVGIIVSLIFVRSLIIPIETLSKDAQKRAKEMQIIASGIAHEVRNPLSAISGFAEILNGRLQDLSLKNLTTSIVSEIKSLNKVVTDFLDFSHQISLNKSQINLNKLLEECISISFQKDNNITIIREFDTKSRNLFADYDNLKYCFINLFINAKEAMKDGGTLVVKTKFDFGHVKIEVIDTGIGFLNDILQNIFLPFFTTKDKGTGIGLAIVKKIVDAHNGKIEVESKHGKGSNFKVTLPL